MTDQPPSPPPTGPPPDADPGAAPEDSPMEEAVRFAEESLGVLDLQAPEEGDEITARLIEQARQEALDLRQVAQEPVTVGVVGEFSAGKSLLVGTLLGRPDLLPVEVRATTGNVTALHLAQGPAGEPTRLERDAVVEFLSRRRARECVLFMLGELAHKVRQDLPGADLSALEGYDPVADDWRAFEAWARTALWGAEPANPRHRRLAHEILLFRDAYLGGQSVLGDRAAMPADLIRGALDLGDIAAPPEVFPQRRSVPFDADAVGESPTALQAAFPLIRRVTYRVSVAPEAWDLGRLRGERDLVLLDFPGLGSEGSGSRDAYLSHSELGDVSTILVVLRANQPNTAVPLEFYGMLQRHGRSRAELEDAVLVAGNKFDAVPVPPLPAQPRVSAQHLRAASQYVAGFDVTGRELVQGRPDRVLPVSAVAGIHAYGYRYEQASQESRHEVETLLREHAEARKRRSAEYAAPSWDDWALRIGDSFPTEPWAARLRDFEADGGIDALRRLVEGHVRRHGVRLKAARVAKRRGTLAGLLRKLAALVRATGGEDGKALGEAEVRLRELRSVLGRIQSDLDQLRDPTVLTYGSGVSLLDALRRKAITEVFGWPEWHNLVNHVEGGLVAVGGAAASEDGGRRRGRLSSGARKLAGGADDVYSTRTFRKRFDETVGRLAAETFEHVAQWAEQFTEGWRERLADLDAWWRDDRTQALLAGPFAELDADDLGEQRKEIIGLLTDVGWIPEELDAAVLGPAKEAGGGTWRDGRFPQREGHDLPWNVSVAGRLEAHQKAMELHQMRAFRMRREIAEAAAEVCAELALDLLEQSREFLAGEFRSAQGLIPVGAQLRRRGPGRPAGRGGPGPAERDAEEPPERGVSPLLDHLATWGIDA
ncbi:hypothetical protein RKE29_24945 [Streptomyces sp. B1866]|uniref:hypothetical protein n=1 Tax=Streptomyces sp. B1866 TaxID=3075431 RepID=UPI00288F0DD2|nr:hypothetical protein [Streptomyces sp. B1866]MDT3399845.1 hypothetical protein [Streptomyces sp. B1866]